MSEVKKLPDNIFVLDIGTRSVMALLADLEDEELNVYHLINKEHKTRAMLDGQIHNVEKVAQVIKELVDEMKELSGQELKSVAVAAAGRSLKTVHGKAKMRHPIVTTFSRDEVISLELQAVQNAQFKLPKQDNNSMPLSQQYYCVGYSVIEEWMDNISLESLVGQRGQEAELEVVATFLPRIVVDSLQTAVEMAGLELASITLEPIAVANLVLSPAMRRLNLVLVDIGAGTSDIAVCGGNTISAFGMVPVAGDEITEALSDHYILDFNKAEEVKRLINSKETIETVNVLGIEETLDSREVKEIIQPAVDNLSVEIAKEVISLNGKPPQAILLVGGGSLSPDLPGKLAKKIGLAESRVVVQQANKIQQVKNLADNFSGPDFITVLGIAYTALKYPTMGFITVNINDYPVRMLQLTQNNVAEALLAGGYNPRDLYGRPGLALTCEINGELYTLPGKIGQVGSITLNGCEANLSDKVKQGDKITIILGETGENASATFQEILQDKLGYCTVNGQNVELKPIIKGEQQEFSLHDQIPDGCKVEVAGNYRIIDLLQQCGQLCEEQYILLNGSELNISGMAIIKKNGKRTKPDEKVSPGDSVTYEQKEDLKLRDILPKIPEKSLTVTVNDKRIVLSKTNVYVNKKPASLDTLIKGGDSVEYEIDTKPYQPILVDIFNAIQFSTDPPPDKSHLKILVNSQEVTYTQPLKDGDNIEIYWE